MMLTGTGAFPRQATLHDITFTNSYRDAHWARSSLLSPVRTDYAHSVERYAHLSGQSVILGRHHHRLPDSRRDALLPPLPIFQLTF
jgi:hypothetical protein